MTLEIFLTLGGVALISSLLLTPWVAVLAKKLGVMQEPPEETIKKLADLKREKKISDTEYETKLMAARRRPNKKAIIQWGGIGYVVPFLVISGVALLGSKSINLPKEEFSTYVMWFIMIGILFVMGIFDDLFEFSGKVQFSFYVFATLLLAISKIDITGFNSPFGGFVNLNLWSFQTHISNFPLSFLFPGDLLILFWALPLMVGLKVQGGSDGLMEGNVFLGALFLFIVSFLYGQPTAALFAIIIAGSVLGFLYYNFYPHKLMSASSGKSVIGFILAGITIIESSKFAISLIVFAIPILDFAWVLLRRWLYYKPKTPIQLFMISDRFHLHFRLMKMGFSERGVAYLEYSLTILFGTLAVLLPQYKLYVLLLTWLSIGGMIVYVTFKTSDAQ